VVPAGDRARSRTGGIARTILRDCGGTKSDAQGAAAEISEALGLKPNLQISGIFPSRHVCCVSEKLSKRPRKHLQTLPYKLNSRGPGRPLIICAQVAKGKGERMRRLKELQACVCSGSQTTPTRKTAWAVAQHSGEADQASKQFRPGSLKSQPKSGTTQYLGVNLLQTLVTPMERSPSSLNGSSVLRPDDSGYKGIPREHAYGKWRISTRHF